MSADSLDEVLGLFYDWGHEPDDDGISPVEHAAQSAALAVADRADDHMVAAALLHDLGHLLRRRDGVALDRDGVPIGHEHRAARYLRAVMPPSVNGWIALHVAAKRYACAVEPGYVDQLPEGSRRSLETQGGPMTAVETAEFELHQGFLDALRLRRWDDRSREHGVVVPGLEAYADLLGRVAR